MLRIQMIGLALVTVLAMSAAIVESASATVLPHEWLLNGKLIGSPVKIHSLGLILLTDDTSPGGALAVHCKTFGTRTVGPHALGLVEKITAELLGTNNKITCSFDKRGVCEASPAPLFSVVNLPWHTELTLLGSGLRDMIMSDGAGSPGWAVICKTILGNVTDTCTIALASTQVENVASGVLELFDSLSNLNNPANCKVGAEAIRQGVGLAEGSITYESPPSGELKAL